MFKFFKNRKSDGRLKTLEDKHIIMAVIRNTSGNDRTIRFEKNVGVDIDVPDFSQDRFEGIVRREITEKEADGSVTLGSNGEVFVLYKRVFNVPFGCRIEAGDNNTAYKINGYLELRIKSWNDVRNEYLYSERVFASEDDFSLSILYDYYYGEGPCGLSVRLKNDVIACVEELVNGLKKERTNGFSRTDIKYLLKNLLYDRFAKTTNGWFSVQKTFVNVVSDSENVEDGSNWCERLFAEKERSVVKILLGGRSSAAGVIISDRGYVLTNLHVVSDKVGDPRNDVTVSFIGDQTILPVDVVASDKTTDTALLKFTLQEGLEFSVAKFIGDYSAVSPGAEVMLIGNTIGMGISPAKGNVRFPKNDEGNLITTIPADHGDSGGPIFNKDGFLIGINKNRISGENIEQATPAVTLKELIEKWKKDFCLDDLSLPNNERII